ncbi:MAG: hypothetical protein HYZ91_01840, partial [Candidatus Omnitrophica bacterium]|nr:hypothetical protein [Candidatus Omnitrophota bacterium]
EPSSQKPTPANESAPNELELNEPWLEAIPVPTDPELEAQIKEIQEALGAIYQQMVRRKEALLNASDPAAKTVLYEELEQLRKERKNLEALLHELIDEAKVSERTAIDEALARARWLERRQEYWEQKEELLRDRQP